MRRTQAFLALVLVIGFNLPVAIRTSALAQEWEFRKPKGTLKVVDLFLPSASLMFNYAEAYVPY